MTMTETPTPPTAIDERSASASTNERSAPKSGIGRIVIGTVLGGLITAVLLVTVVVAGAREHVITGSVLLAFAGAWATLALLSERRTDQPQRWARVPAVVMSVAGTAILVLAPTGNQAGWIWPPAIFALAVWMTVQARRSLHNRTRRRCRGPQAPHQLHRHRQPHRRARARSRRSVPNDVGLDRT